VSEHLSEELIERYKLRRLSAAELLSADDHLAVCKICRNRVERPEEQTSFSFLRGGLRAEARRQPQHLPFELLAAYVDDVGDEVDREIAQSHLELCTACANEAEDLRAFRTEMRTYSELLYIPANRPNLREKFLAFWRAPRYRIPLQVAGLTAMALLIGWVVTLPLRRQVADLQAQVIDLQRTNDALAELREQEKQLQPSGGFILNGSREIAVALYDNEELITLDKNGNLSGLQLSTENEERVKSALLTGQVAAPDLEELSRKRGTLLGPSPGVPFALVSPVGIVMQKERPNFRWRPLAGAATYIVQVFDSSFTKVMASPPLTVTEWTASGPLQRGRIYSWQVVARVDGKEVMSPEPPAPEAKFKVLEQSQVSELDRVKRDYPKSHLALGTAYASVGLLDEAEREFRALVIANPKSPAAQRLLNRIQALSAAR
jgi:anti-sigma factor RsiW